MAIGFVGAAAIWGTVSAAALDVYIGHRHHHGRGYYDYNPTGTRTDLIIKLADRYKLPAVYQERSYGAAGGLVSYGPNFLDQFRRAADYVDRILKGNKPADMPMQAPTKYELVVMSSNSTLVCYGALCRLLALFDRPAGRGMGNFRES
jgi:ABC transporter substrate binding protein